MIISLLALATATRMPPPIVQTPPVFVPQPPPLASPPPPPREVSDFSTAFEWTVAIDHTLQDGCFALTTYDNNIALRIGVNPVESDAYVMIASQSWKSLQKGKDYKLQLQFDDESPWEGTAKAVDMHGLPALWISFDKPKFFDEFAVKQALTITWKEKRIAHLRLDHSDVAVKDLLRCQKATNATTDPFKPSPKAKPVVDPSDPFAT